MKLDSEDAYDKLIAYTFIQGTDKIIACKIKEDLDNKCDLGVNSYPWILEK